MALFSYATKLTDAFTSQDSPQEEETHSDHSFVESDNTTNTGRLENKVCLIILDGWGLSDQEDGNAILKANTPVMDKLLAENSVELMSHGEHVGLPEGLMGNSEVGHLNIGAGRIIQQDILRIDQAMKNNEFKSNKTLLAAIGRAKPGTGRLHLVGLVSDGGVHSHIDHMFELIKVAKKNEVPEVFLHFIADGRDTAPKSAIEFLQRVVDFFKEEEYGKLATIIGRYYAMDRDRRWERTCKAYEALIAGEGEECEDDKAITFVEGCYKGKDSDEFLKPTIFGGDDRRISKGDTVIFFNCRADRMRQLAEVVAFGNNKRFETKYRHPKDLGVFTMTQYNTDFEFPVLFPSPHYDNVLAEWLSVQGISQFHCAETEKYAHITYFFNGGQEEQFQHEKRCLVHSPKIETYDKQPEMSSAEIANNMLEYISREKRPFLMCNLAAPDMVSHTGNHGAAVKAIEATDETIGWILEACEQHGYILLVTADHGNAEKMKDDQSEPHKAHTCSPVPFVCNSRKYRLKKDINMDRSPALCDVAPTILDIMGLPKPKEMTGFSLLERATDEESTQESQQDEVNEEKQEEPVDDGGADVETYPKKESNEKKDMKTAEIQTQLKASDMPEDLSEEKTKAGAKDVEKRAEKNRETWKQDEESNQKEKAEENSNPPKDDEEVKTYPPKSGNTDKASKNEVIDEQHDESQSKKRKDTNRSVTPTPKDNRTGDDKKKNKEDDEDQGKPRKAANKEKKQGDDMINVDQPTKIEKRQEKHGNEEAKEVKLPEEKRKEYEEDDELVKEVERKNEKANPGGSDTESEKDEDEATEKEANMNYVETKGTKEGEKEEAIEVKETSKNNEEDVQVTAVKGRAKQSG